MSRTRSWKGARVHTVGHSTRTLEELVELLRSFQIEVLADIRTVPRSRHNPQFDRAALSRSLRSRRIRYAHLARLGGLRHARKDSTNTAWRNASFRGFADYMQTPEFEAGLEELRELAKTGRVALMCAEAVPWRCHRSLVADALSARGARVEHITSRSRSSPHRLTGFAKVDGGRVTYPGEPEAGGRLDVAAPFHLEATVRVLQRRPANRVDVWDEARYLRVIRTSEGLVLVRVEEHGTIDAPDLRFSVLAGPGSPARAEIVRTLRRVLGLDVDPAPLQRLAASEPRLRATARALRGMRPPRFASLFETFLNVLPFQQVSLDSGIAIVGRLVERFGDDVEHGGRRWFTAPSAECIAAARLDALRRCGLSARKAESLRGLARRVASGEVREETLSSLGTVDALSMLTELPGIGAWSAGLVLLRGLGRLDVFPSGDAGAARGLGALLGTRSTSSLPRPIERAGDARGYLYFCVLGAALLRRGLIHAAPSAPPRRAPRP